MSSASQEIPCIYGTRRFITAFTRAYHFSLNFSVLLDITRNEGFEADVSGLPIGAILKGVTLQYGLGQLDR